MASGSPAVSQRFVNPLEFGRSILAVVGLRGCRLKSPNTVITHPRDVREINKNNHC